MIISFYILSIVICLSYQVNVTSIDFSSDYISSFKKFEIVITFEDSYAIKANTIFNIFFSSINTLKKNQILSSEVTQFD